MIGAVEEVLRRAGADAGAVEAFAHGMTVGTNALLEERGARTALIATRGFADLLEIARQDRPDLYRLCAPKPAPLVERELRFEAAERIGPGGVLEPLGEGEPERLAALLRESGAESVAICLLFSYLDPSHERRLAEHLRASCRASTSPPRTRSCPASASTSAARRPRSTPTSAPLLGRYLDRLGEASSASGLPAPLVMQSSGGVATAAEAARAGAWSVLSGPAGGAVGAGLLARASGDGNAIGFDMGGTSCDVCVVDDGAVRRTDSRRVEGRTIQLPMVDVHTVGAGGGSIGWRDRGGALRVGPRSAGADPGPSCYGRGGREPTVTDANLLLGNLAADSRLAGGVELDADAASEAVRALADSLGLGELETAEGIVRIADQEMVRALRVVTVERGVDPRRYALLPFGGAGPMHAAAIAAELGIERILCPRAGGVLSALGLCASDRRRDTSRTVMLEGGELSAERIAAEVARPDRRDRRRAGGRGAGAGLRDALRGPGLRAAGAGAARARPGRPGRALRARPRGALRPSRQRGRGRPRRHPPGDGLPGPRPRPAAPDRSELTETSRRVRFGGEWVETPILRGEPPAGTEAAGPVVYELPEATFVVPPGWTTEVDGAGTIVAELDEQARTGAGDG